MLSIGKEEEATGSSRLGLVLGARIGERCLERAEQVAGIALSLPGVYLVAKRLLHWIRQRERPLAVAA